MASFDIAIEKVLANEGGYVNDPDDPGGKTKYGISERAFPQVDIPNLTLEQAKEIYRNQYWMFDQVASQDVANKLLDMAVNFGVIRTVYLLQKILGINSDGQFGSITLSHTNQVDSLYLMQELRVACAVHYAKIVAYKPSQLKYINGWMRRALS